MRLRLILIRLLKNRICSKIFIYNDNLAKIVFVKDSHNQPGHHNLTRCRFQYYLFLFAAAE